MTYLFLLTYFCLVNIAIHVIDCSIATQYTASNTCITRHTQNGCASNVKTVCYISDVVSKFACVTYLPLVCTMKNYLSDGSPMYPTGLSIFLPLRLSNHYLNIISSHAVRTYFQWSIYCLYSTNTFTTDLNPYHLQTWRLKIQLDDWTYGQ